MGKSVSESLFDVTPQIEALAKKCEENNEIEKELYTKYEVKRGLRDLNGKGVLAGLTNVSDVRAKKIVNGEEVPCEGNLYYRETLLTRSHLAVLRIKGDTQFLQIHNVPFLEIH